MSCKDFLLSIGPLHNDKVIMIYDRDMFYSRHGGMMSPSKMTAPCKIFEVLLGIVLTIFRTFLAFAIFR